MRRKRRKNKQIKFIIISSLSLLFILTVGYAAFQTNLNISAKGNIKNKRINVNDLKQDVVTAGDGLYIDVIDEGRYIYRGINPNNYITFNNELWRIISLEQDNTLKIMNDNDLGMAIAWDDNANPEWENASLNKYLNETYYNNLNTQDKGFISNHKFNTGKLYIKWEDDISTTSVMQDASNEKRESWQGNVGILNATDFVKSSLDTKCISARSSWISETEMPCKNQNWLYKDGEFFWTINANDPSNPNYIHNGWLIHKYIGGSGLNAKYSTENVGLKAYPVVYLKSDITLKGEGTQNNPYTIN